MSFNNVNTPTYTYEVSTYIDLLERRLTCLLICHVLNALRSHLSFLY